MANRENADEAAARFVKVARNSYEAVVEHMAALQDRNIRFAQGMIYALGQEYRQQAEANRVMTREMVERAEEQRDALRAVVGSPFDAYVDLLYAPLSYYKKGLERAGMLVR